MPADLFGVLRASHERRSRSEPADRVPGISVARMPVLDPAVVKDSYRFGEALGQETQTIEFKGTRDAENDMLRVLKDKISRYLCAFLNSGGAILFGVDDDGIVRGGQLGAAQRAAAVKLIDAAAQLIDPQVEPDAIMPPRFVPVADAAQPDTCVLLVVVLRGRQPVYYLSPHSTDAFLRRHESVFLIEWSLVRQREAAAATPVRRSWRHIAGRLLPFDDHIADLRARLCPSRVPRLWAMRRLAAMLAAADCPTSEVTLPTFHLSMSSLKSEHGPVCDSNIPDRSVILEMAPYDSIAAALLHYVNFRTSLQRGVGTQNGTPPSVTPES